MEKITTAGTQPEMGTTDLEGGRKRTGRPNEELRALADYELMLVGGGDDGPGWNPPH